jgi:hypothetical protein
MSRELLNLKSLLSAMSSYRLVALIDRSSHGLHLIQEAKPEEAEVELKLLRLQAILIMLMWR